MEFGFFSSTENPLTIRLARSAQADITNGCGGNVYWQVAVALAPTASQCYTNTPWGPSRLYQGIRDQSFYPLRQDARRAEVTP